MINNYNIDSFQSNFFAFQEKICKNDKETKDVNLNNICGIDEKMFCEIFDGLRTNDALVRLSAANCDISDFAGATLNLAIETNQVKIKSNKTLTNKSTHVKFFCIK